MNELAEKYSIDPNILEMMRVGSLSGPRVRILNHQISETKAVKITFRNGLLTWHEWLITSK